MKQIKKEELKAIIDRHNKWLSGDGGEAADLSGADLRWADLRRADLRRADLRWADLRWADLSGADLCRADLRRADLRWADLRRADLRRADLSGADLRRADLSGANLRYLIGDIKRVKTIRADKWDIVFADDVMAIGCQQHKISEWIGFSDDEISSMDSRALEWWRVWKPIVIQIIEASKCK